MAARRRAPGPGHGRAPGGAAATQACTVAAQQQLPYMHAFPQHCRGLLAADPALLHAAADAFAEVRYPLFGAQALENAAVLHAERGEASAARAAYSRAVGTYTELGAAWNLMRADARLRPLGIRRGVRGARKRPATGWEALTPAESKIAELVAAGQSNPDIAAALYLSRTTVQTHVSHILAKVGVQSRVEIARHALARPSRTHPELARPGRPHRRCVQAPIQANISILRIGLFTAGGPDRAVDVRTRATR